MDAGRVALRGTHDARAFEVDVTVSRDRPRRARLNGDTLRSAEHLRHAFHTLVFTPDRLAVVKGGPAVRRAYLDRSLARISPAKAALPTEYATALGQRNAALRRVALGISSRGALAPWTASVVEAGAALVAARREATALVASRFAELATRIGLEDATLAYEGDPPSHTELEAKLARDVERGFTGAGPHLHDLRIEASARDLRTYGSQGEQRTAVLALVLGEAQAIVERTGVEPLVLLDDVLSELDGDRRRALVEILVGGGQTVITATAAAALPVEPAQLLIVEDGDVREA